MPSCEIVPVVDAEVVASEGNSVVVPDPTGLSKKEQMFCELYAAGNAPYAGNMAKCYEEVFGDSEPDSGMRAYLLLSRPDVQRYLSEISALGYERSKYMKKFLNSTLMHIVDEMAYCKPAVDRNGKPIPASSSRGVAVSAAKLLMDLNGLKAGGHENELKIKNGSGGNITFNVIVPGSQKKEEIDQ